MSSQLGVPREVTTPHRKIPIEIPDLVTLGHYPIVEQICQLRRGLILLTGITGSGKSGGSSMMSKLCSQMVSPVWTFLRPTMAAMSPE